MRVIKVLQQKSPNEKSVEEALEASKEQGKDCKRLPCVKRRKKILAYGGRLQ